MYETKGNQQRPIVDGVGMALNPFRTAVPFLVTNYLEFEWLVPQHGTAVLKEFRV